MLEIPKVVKDFTDMYIENYLVPKGSYGTSDEELCLNYLDKYWITDEKERVDKMTFYKFFKKMTNNNMSNISFWRYLKTSLNKIGIIERKDGKAFIEGIKINPEYEEELNQFINNNNVEEKE
jgi:hypothetical protein